MMINNLEAFLYSAVESDNWLGLSVLPYFHCVFEKSGLYKVLEKGRIFVLTCLHTGPTQ